MGTQQFCLRWNNHQSNLINVFEELLHDETLVDVTLACDGVCIKAHKVVLSACSPYFKEIFIHNPCKHPVVILKDITFAQVQAIIEFMYKGEVNISHEELPAFLKTAETLKVKGLTEVRNEAKSMPVALQNDNIYPEITGDQNRNVSENDVQPCSPPAKRKKLKRNRNPSGSDSSNANTSNPGVTTLMEQNNLSEHLSGNAVDNTVEILPEIVKIESENSACHEDAQEVHSAMRERNQEDSSSSFLHVGGAGGSGVYDQSDINTSMVDQQWDNQSNQGINQGPSGSGVQQPSQGSGIYLNQTSKYDQPVFPSNSYYNVKEVLRDSTTNDTNLQIDLLPPYPLKILPQRLDFCLRSSKGSPTHLLRTLMDVYFSQACLASSTVRTLDQNIIECLKAYVMNIYPSVKGTQLNVAATDKCIQTKRKLGLIPSKLTSN